MRKPLGLGRNILILFGAVLVLGMGEELWVRFIPKYLEVLGAGAWAIAVYGALRDLLDAVYQYPGGWLADRIGRRATLILSAFIAICGYLLYLFAGGWELVLVGTILVMSWNSLTLPATFAVIGDNLEREQRAVGFGVQSILKRIPIVIAPPIGGWLILRLGFSSGLKLGFLITIVFALLSVFFLRRFYIEKSIPASTPLRFTAMWQAMDSRLKRLLMADCLARWAEGIPKVFIVLYAIDFVRINALDFGWLTSLQMLTSIVIYIPIARLSDRMNRKPFVLLTFAFFALFPLAFVLSSTLPYLALAFVMAGLRETGEPARKALIVDLAAETARGRAVGVYYFIRGLVVFPASFAGGLLWNVDPRLPFLVAFVVGVAGFLFYLFASRD